ncbi:hypothetical protein [Actinokineospora iranica]|uniref:ATP-binding protein n=1 Tax=Actinokineospora iranica TaxID=1271860 RepID=A0A1G6VCG1_9PSEU|nr:hypothetical protein [Actinokineospora iranica]SDD51154.1 hypothetical protein SAMN05216174_11255 [Actinokineospora iranica]
MNRHLVRIASAAATVGAMSLAGVGLAAADTPEPGLPVSASESDIDELHAVEVGTDDKNITDVAKTEATEKILPAGVMSLVQGALGLGGNGGPLSSLTGGNGGPLSSLTGGNGGPLSSLTGGNGGPLNGLTGGGSGTVAGE